jgi:hypothetical protein
MSAARGALLSAAAAGGMVATFVCVVAQNPAKPLSMAYKALWQRPGAAQVLEDRDAHQHLQQWDFSPRRPVEIVTLPDFWAEPAPQR